MIGTKLAHYQITSHLGSGGMGEVYLAEDTILRRLAALKILSPDVVSESDRLQRFVEEARAAAALSHPNIATIYEFRQEDGIPFIAMEYVEGETLSAKIAGHTLDNKQILDIATQIAVALNAAHVKNIIHRDIKPANIIVTPSGQVKVLDFGLAKRLVLEESLSEAETQMLTQPGFLVGTAPYMSPEQALGRSIDHRSDLFSFGVVLYEMVTGRLPFSGATAFETINHIINTAPEAVERLNANMPLGLERIISRCLQKRVEDRFANARELVNDLKQPDPDRKSRSRRGSRNNLPQQLSLFIGRQRETTQVERLLSRTRLLTLTGPGGIGKTRLALQVAANLVNEYSEGVYFVDLAPLLDPDLVPQTTATALGVHEEPGRSILDTLTDYSKQRSLLIILDNCEHLISACAQLADTLLLACPNLRILATSREALGIIGETVFRMPSLSVPDPQRLPTIETLGEYEAVQLFVDRASSVQRTFTVTAQNAPALAQICIRLEGIPLAIELAASRVKALSVEKILARMEDRLGLLTGGSRTALPRHQTLRAAIEWSYNLLSGPEQILFCRLSVFSGGWTLEAAEAVCSGNGVPESAVLDLISGLVDKSLVFVEDRRSQQRYGCLVSLSEYAQLRLMESADRQNTLRRRAEFFLEFAEEGERKLQGSGQEVWLDQLEAERENMRAVLAWALEMNVGIALRLAGALARFWEMHGHFNEGRKWLAETLEAKDSHSYVAERAKALAAASLVAWNLGEYARAQSFSEEALILFRGLDNKWGIAHSLNRLGSVAHRRGDWVAARGLFEESLAIGRELGDAQEITSSLEGLSVVALNLGDHAAARALMEEDLEINRKLGDKRRIARALNNLGTVAEALGDYAAAHGLYKESATIKRELGYKSGLVNTLNNLGIVTDLFGDHDAARSLYEESLMIGRELGDKYGIAHSLNGLGEIAVRYGDSAAACSLIAESLAISRELGNKRAIAKSIEILAALALARGQNELAVCVWAGAESFRESALVPRPPNECAQLEGSIAIAHSVLTQETFDAAWARGRTMALDEILSQALQITS